MTYGINKEKLEALKGHGTLSAESILDCLEPLEEQKPLRVECGKCGTEFPSGTHLETIRKHPCEKPGQPSEKPKQSFTHWLKNHPCTEEELWKIQNCLGTLLGYEHPLAQEAVQAWKRSE